MSDLVLVRYDLGDEYEITARGRAYAEANGLDIIDEPAVGRDGSIRPTERVRKRSGRAAKPKTSVSREAAKKTATKKRTAAKKTTSATRPGTKKAAVSAEDNTPSKED